MKPALIFGLALAANALTADHFDNELLVASSAGRFDGLTKLTNKIPRIMFDEQADDELLAIKKPFEESKHDIYLRGQRERLLKKAREESKKAEESHQSLLGKHIQADDELHVMNKDLLPQDGIRRFYTPYFDKETGEFKILPGQYTKFMAADDEELFFTAGQRLGSLVKGNPTIMFDEVADDELGVKIVYLPNPDHHWYSFDDDELVVTKKLRDEFPTKDTYRRHEVSLSEELADDELVVSDQKTNTNQPNQDTHTIRIYKWMMHTKDDELVALSQNGSTNRTIIIPCWAIQAQDSEFIEDELVVSDQYGRKNQPEQGTRTIIIQHWMMRTRDDETADDELLHLQRLPPVEAFRSYEDWHRFVTMMSEEADDELAFISKAPRVPIDRSLVKPVKNITGEALVRDDEADDELALLGQLLKDQIPKPFRRFDDDEFRAKSEKSAQEMGTEGPRMKRKLRPVGGDYPLAQN